MGVSPQSCVAAYDPGVAHLLRQPHPPLQPVFPLQVLEDFTQLERRSEEISGPIANATCSAHVHGLPYYFHEITPLWLACYFNVWDSALLLLRRGSDPNKAVSRNPDGRGYVRTPLYWAAVSGATVVCRSLLANGARQDIDTGG